MNLLLGIPVIGCLSCNKDLDLPVVVDIPAAFQISMNENLQPGQRPLKVELTSLEVLDCTNYSIDYHLDQGSKKIHLTINDWGLNEPCEPGSGVAKEELNLGFLPDGDYKLLISLKDVVQNDGVLLVRPEHYSIRMETANGILVDPGTLNRLPENTIWGGVFPRVDSVQTLGESFLGGLESIVGPETFSPGIYSSFEINADGKVILHGIDEKGAGSTFVFHFTGNRADLVDLVEYYRFHGDGDLMIYVFDEDGYIY